MTVITGIATSSVLTFESRQHSTPGDLAVIYIGADDCGPCLTWRRAHRPRFLASPEFTQISYREIISAKLFDLSKDEHWPNELRELRNEFNRQPGAPMWLVFRDDRLLVTARGLREWEEIALPKLKSLAR